MWDNGKYVFFKSDKSAKTSEQMVKHWASWAAKYPIVLIEDGMAENDEGEPEKQSADRWFFIAQKWFMPVADEDIL